MSRKQYIGDGVYVRYEPTADPRCSEIILTTENGIETTNMIALDRRMVGIISELCDKFSKMELD